MKIKIAYLNSPVTWDELMNWAYGIDLGPIYYMEKESPHKIGSDPVVVLYGWSDDADIMKKFLEERNASLFIVKDIKMNKEDYEAFRKEYAQFYLKRFEILDECEIGTDDFSQYDDTVEIIATRLESSFLVDSTDSMQFMESILMKNAKYRDDMFTEDFNRVLGSLGYFNYACQNDESMYTIDIYKNKLYPGSDEELEEYQRELIEMGYTANDNHYSVVDGRNLIIGRTGYVHYLRLFRYAFWFTYMDTVPDYSSIYHL